MKFFKTPIGTIVMVVVIMIPVIIGMAYVLRKKDKIPVQMNPFSNEPMETTYNSPLSKISSSKDKPEEKEEPKKAEKKDLKAENIEKPKANVSKPKAKNKKTNNKQNNRPRVIYVNSPVKPYTGSLRIFSWL